jgi:sugar phosphate isomerase/epimerase
MKLAYMAATPEVKSMPLAWVGDLDAILPRVAEIGYEGIEFQMRDPSQVDRAKLERQVREAGLVCTAISSGQVGAEDGLYFVHPDEDVRRRAVERFEALLDFAAEFGVDASIGRMRGTLKSAPSKQQGWDWFRAAIEQLVAHAARRGNRVVLEPQMRFNTDFLNTFDETIAFIDSLGRPPQLVFEGDAFHQVMEEKSLIASWVRGQLSGLMTYVQLGDSNRLAPGWGHLPWVDLIESLKAAGYGGWLSMEFTQAPDPDRSARQAHDFIRGLL